MHIQKKHIVIVGLLGLVAVLALPVTNLIVGQTAPEAYTSIECSVAEVAAAKEIIGDKCLLCHVKEPDLPFYVALPVIGEDVRNDAALGLDKVDFTAFYKHQGEDQVIAAKLEHAVAMNTMPPKKFLAMHWDAGLSKKDQDVILASVAKVRADNYATGLAADAFRNDAVQPLPGKWNEALSSDEVALGKLLYNDKRLSGDDTVSCATCHDMGKGGTDGDQFSTGVREQVGGINAPTVFNAAYNVLQFWDGRAKDLADQAAGPPLNPIEMDSNWVQITGKLAKDEGLTKIYSAVYGSNNWASNNIQNAIAAFEKTLITPDSALDQYLKGDASAMSDSAKNGYALFKSRSCATCHTGAAMGGQSFEKATDPVAYYASRNKTPVKEDFGRFNATKKEGDRYKLKVPLLRNIALTAPYLHDGFTSDLSEVVNIMSDYFVTPSNKKSLSASEVADLVAMLEANTGTLPE